MKTMTCLRIAGLAILVLVLCSALLFLPAGRLGWVRGWLFLALLLGTGLVLIALVWRRDPELLRRRMRTGFGTRGWDRVIAPLLKLGFSAEMLVGALDAGPRGRDSMSFALWPLGATLFLIGFVLITRAMLANTHFESFVRIQHDRAHRVVDTGPYRLVRHPGYAGFALQIAAVPILLGSSWAFVPTTATLALLLLRTVLEDRLLQCELAGYAEYAARVRFRLVPWCW